MADRSYILEITPHKVRTGETLAGLAKANKLSLQMLAKFNWGTSDPAEINRHLQDDVGCTKRTGDGKNYKFDDSDHPGLIYIPRPWRKTTLATSHTHIMRVRRLEPKRIVRGYVWVQFVTSFDYPLACIESTLKGGGREWPAQRTSDDGELFWEGLPLSQYAIELELSKKTIKVHVPWVREKFALHYERVIEADVLVCSAPSVLGLQVRLMGLGYDPGPYDGILGSKTVAALRNFQENQGLEVTGQADEGTQAILADLYGA